MLSAHIQQLYRARDLNTGLEWVAMCPDQGARSAMVQLVGEEMGALLSGVIYAAESDAAQHDSTVEPEVARSA